ncbi:MAG: hypothetical protein A3J75_05525 [Acidobacteria bacterium RBG_16_68_9]|nr:MAG: hypothetical protein A3J75_05525 [Acidobacteria bacterium RBG_16_68_9]
MARRKTAFDRYVAARMKSKDFAREYRKARTEISATDAIMRELEAARAKAHLTKAQLARLAGMQPEVVRRLLTAKDVNPEMNTVSRLAAGLGYTLALVKR